MLLDRRDGVLNRRVGLALSLVGVGTLDVNHVGKSSATSVERTTGPFGCLGDEDVVVFRAAFSSGLLLCSAVALESALRVFGEELQSRSEVVAGDGEDADEEDEVSSCRGPLWMLKDWIGCFGGFGFRLDWSAVVWSVVELVEIIEMIENSSAGQTGLFMPCLCLVLAVASCIELTSGLKIKKASASPPRLYLTRPENEIPF